MINLSNLAENKNKIILVFLIILVLLISLAMFYKPIPKTNTGVSQQPSGAKGTPSPPPILKETPATSSGQPSAEIKTDLSEITKLKEILPYATPHFQVSYDSNSKLLQVTLYATINQATPEAFERYAAQLKEYRTEFLEWLKSNKADSEKVAIVYTPDPDNPFKKEEPNNPQQERIR